MRESNSWPCIRILIAETAMGLLKTWLKICGKWTQFTEQQSRPMYYHQHHRWWWWCWCCYCWWCLESGLSSANWWSNCKIEAPFLFMWSDNGMYTLLYAWEVGFCTEIHRIPSNYSTPPKKTEENESTQKWRVKKNFCTIPKTQIISYSCGYSPNAYRSNIIEIQFPVWRALHFSFDLTQLTRFGSARIV